MVLPRWIHGPASITLVRHGESIGNEADARAREEHAEELELDERDADVELSEAGRDQADAIAKWLAGAEDDWRPTVALSSPFRRAAETAERALRDTGVDVQLDERLRERDLGLFDGLTKQGVRSRYPEEAARRRKVGKFYYQPPGGESWADVALRVRSLLTDLRFGYDGERIWVFTHQAVIMTFRHVLEGLSEERLLEIDHEVSIPNASYTRFVRDGDGFRLETFADTRAVDEHARTVTREGSHPGHGRPNGS